MILQTEMILKEQASLYGKSESEKILRDARIIREIRAGSPFFFFKVENSPIPILKTPLGTDVRSAGKKNSNPP